MLLTSFRLFFAVIYTDFYKPRKNSSKHVRSFLQNYKVLDWPWNTSFGGVLLCP